MPYGKESLAADIIADPSAKAIVDRYMPGALDDPMIALGLSNLRAVVDSPFGTGNPAVPERMWVELAALPSGTSRPAPQGEPNRRPVIDRRDRPRPSATLRWYGRAEKWNTVEVSVAGPSEGNPFIDVDFRVVFTLGERHVEVGGFYDGEGIYRARFLPDDIGTWRFATASNSHQLADLRGVVEVFEPGADNPGPVRVARTFHFEHASGRPFVPTGTTLYAWTHQTDELEAQTLRTLAHSPFNKVRMCTFPKSYLFNEEEPPRQPYATSRDGGHDFSRFNPAFFRHLEERIRQLGELGIECDLILFHPYDRWGFSQMPAWADDLYVRYLIRRLAAFRNVWWSLANEFDLMPAKTAGDWERFAGIIAEEDHVGHLVSVHNCVTMFDHTKPWVTHCSIQRIDVYKTAENTDAWRAAYGKPVVVDECGYEGDIDQGWGNLSAQEVVRRAWEASVRGGYFTHGETYLNESGTLWWSKGGALVGDAVPRLAFLRSVHESVPSCAIEPLPSAWDAPTGGVEAHRITYFGFERPRYRVIQTPPETEWNVDVIDTWNMVVEELQGTFVGRFTIELPGREYMAVRLRRRDAVG